MSKRYPHAASLAEQIAAKRRARALSFERLGALASVDASQAFRICRGEFKTLNPSVLKICNALGIHPPAEGYAYPQAEESNQAAMLSAEVLSSWDRTDAGALRLRRILRALRQ
jgi:hypothetical protein